MTDETNHDPNGPDGPHENRDEDGDENRDEDRDENAHIRALLAELGSGPDGRSMPPGVAARLDDTLARLVAERSAGGGATASTEVEDSSGTVVPMRARWLPRATAAAAAVIIVGAGGVAAANLGIFGNGSSMSSDSAGGSAEGQVAESAPAPTPASPGGEALTEEDFGRETATSALPQVSASSFASDVTALVQRRTSTKEPDQPPSTGSDAGDDGADLDTPEEAKQGPDNALRFRSCPGPEITDGAAPNPIRYDGKLAVLVIHPEVDGQQRVEAWSCAGDRRLDSTTISP